MQDSFVIQSFREYTGLAPASPPRTNEYERALQLIRSHQQLLINENHISPATLLRALLDHSHQSGFIKYNPWEADILIKRFKHSPLVCQYNPQRAPVNRHAAGQTARPASGRKPDFLAWESFPENEHYLTWESPAHKQYAILAQPAPIVPGHLIIASLDWDSNRKHYPQIMLPDKMEDMHHLQQVLGPLGYAMGYNDREAGASVDHFHTQAVPRHFLPLIRESEREVPGLPPRVGGNSRVKVFLLGEGSAPYPALGAWIHGHMNEAWLAYKKRVLQTWQNREWRFNTLAWYNANGRANEILFPRSRETVLHQTLKAGYVEMAGMLVLSDRLNFDSITQLGEVENALREAGLVERDFFLQTLRKNIQLG